jgi:hypothetical protein
MTIKDWVDTIVLGVVLGLSLWAFKTIVSTWARGIYARLDKLIDIQKDMAISDATQNEKLNQVNGRLAAHDQKFNDHGRRIRNLEDVQARCTIKNENVK